MVVKNTAATYGREDMSRIGQYGVDIRILIFVITFQNPNDIAYVFSGYAPLTVRLAQFLARPQGWRGLEEVNRRVIVQISLCLECNMWTIARD